MSYTYDAGDAGNGTWLVRRTDEDNRVTEAVIRGIPDKETAIKQAIFIGTWA